VTQPSTTLEVTLPDLRDDEPKLTEEQWSLVRYLLDEVEAEGFSRDTVDELGKWQAQYLIDLLTEVTLHKADEKMRDACWAGFVVGIVTATLAAVVLALVEGGSITVNGVAIDVFSFLDAALFFVLSFCIWRSRSVFAAVMIFAFYSFDTLHMWYQVAAAGELPGVVSVLRILVGLPFLYWFFEGARGAVVYQRLRQAHADRMT
jgi:hypothetical protein